MPRLLLFLALLVATLTLPATAGSPPYATNSYQACPGGWPTIAFTYSTTTCSPGDWYYGPPAGGTLTPGGLATVSADLTTSAGYGSGPGNRFEITDPTQSPIMAITTDLYYDPTFNGVDAYLSSDSGGFVLPCVASWDYKLGTFDDCSQAPTISSYSTSSNAITLSSPPYGMLPGQKVTLTGGTSETAYVYLINGNTVYMQTKPVYTGHTAINYQAFIADKTIADCGNCSHNLSQIAPISPNQEWLVWGAIDSYYWPATPGTPPGNVTANVVSGGSLALNTQRCYRVSVMTLAGDTPWNGEGCATPGNSGSQSIQITWSTSGVSNLNNAVGWKIYEGSQGNEQLYNIISNTVSPASFTDTGGSSQILTPGYTPALPPSTNQDMLSSSAKYDSSSGGPGTLVWGAPFKVIGPGCGAYGATSVETLNSSTPTLYMPQTGLSESYSDRIGTIMKMTGQVQNGADQPGGGNGEITFIASATGCDGAFFTSNGGLWDPYPGGSMGTYDINSTTHLDNANLANAYDAEDSIVAAPPSNEWFDFKLSTTNTVPSDRTVVSIPITFGGHSCTFTHTVESTVNGPAGVPDDNVGDYTANVAAEFNQSSACATLYANGDHKMVGILNWAHWNDGTATAADLVPAMGVEDNADIDPSGISPGASVGPTCSNPAGAVTCSALTVRAYRHFTVGPIYNIKGSFYVISGIDNNAESYFGGGHSTGNYGAFACLKTTPSLISSQLSIFTSTTNPTNAGKWTWTACDGTNPYTLQPNHFTGYVYGSNGFIIPGGGSSWTTGPSAHYLIPNPPTANRGSGYYPFYTSSKDDDWAYNTNSAPSPIYDIPQLDQDQNNELWFVYNNLAGNAWVLKYNPATGTSDFAQKVDPASNLPFNGGYEQIPAIQIGPSGTVYIPIIYGNASQAINEGCPNQTGICVVLYSGPAVAGQTSITLSHQFLWAGGGNSYLGKGGNCQPSGDSLRLTCTLTYNGNSYGTKSVKALDIYTP